jgi:hypothetical protein
LAELRLAGFPYFPEENWKFDISYCRHFTAVRGKPVALESLKGLVGLKRLAF